MGEAVERRDATTINLFDTDKEQWKPLTKFGITIPNYFVSNFGRVISTQRSRQIIMKIQNNLREQGGSGRGKASKIVLNAPSNLFEEFDYYNGYMKKGRCKISISVHRAVIEAFCPIDENPPIPMEDWEKTPETAKEFIRDTAIIDHIDDNAFNNHVTNLRWCTPKENGAYFKHTNYNGNKTPLRRADCIKTEQQQQQHGISSRLPI